MNPKVLVLAIGRVALLITESGNIVGGTDFGGGGVRGVDEEFSLGYDKFEISNRYLSGDIK